MTAVATAGGRCVHCGSCLFVIADGPAPVVCRSCLRKLGTVAANPYAIDPAGRQALLDRSLEVLDLRDGRWRWTSVGWPKTGDHALLKGGRA